MYKFATNFALSLAMFGASLSTTLAAAPKNIKTGSTFNSSKGMSAQPARPMNSRPAGIAQPGLSSGIKKLEPQRNTMNLTLGVTPVRPIVKPLDQKFGVNPIRDVKPLKPIDPTKVVSGVRPSQPFKPNNPVLGLDGSKPTTPLRPLKPIDPTKVVSGVRPLKPLMPNNPVLGIDGSKPTTPLRPLKPIDPTKVVSGIRPLNPLMPLDQVYGVGGVKPGIDPVKPIKPGTIKPFNCGTMPTNGWPNQGCGPNTGWGCGGFGGVFGGGFGCGYPGNGWGNYYTMAYPYWTQCQSWYNYSPTYTTPIYTTPVYTTPVYVESTPMIEVAAPAAAVAPAPVPPVAAIDLMIDGVVLVDAGDTAKNLGPLVRVTVSNKGTAAAGKFALGVYASLKEEPSKEMIPSGEMLEELAAGTSRTVEVRLPVEVLGMTAVGSTIKETFKQLFVVADVENMVVESNKQNNILPIKRDQLALN